MPVNSRGSVEVGAVRVSVPLSTSVPSPALAAATVCAVAPPRPCVPVRTPPGIATGGVVAAVLSGWGDGSGEAGSWGALNTSQADVLRADKQATSRALWKGKTTLAE